MFISFEGEKNTVPNCLETVCLRFSLAAQHLAYQPQVIRVKLSDVTLFYFIFFIRQIKSFTNFYTEIDKE